MQGGTAIDPTEREVDIVAGKDAIVRVFVTLESGFANRVLSARLSLIDGDTVERVFHKRTVDGPTVENSLATSFNIEVPGDLIKPTTRYAVELVECAEDAGTEASPRFPATGDEALAARDTGVLRLQFLPLVVNGILANVDPDRVESYRKYMEAMYPVSGVEVSIGPELEAYYAVSANGGGWDVTLQQVAQRHQNDDAPNDIYYYGLMEPAATLGQYCGYGCVAGIGFVPESGPYFKDARVAIGISYGDIMSANTMAHEVGHNHGREHSPCGGASDAGPFPHPGAVIGWWGFYQPDMQLIGPEEATDIMGYCDNQWISDYTYQAILERVSTINGSLSWVNPNPVGTWEVIVTSSFGSTWGVPSNGPVVATGKPEAARVIDNAGNEVAQVTVYRSVMGHLRGASIMVPAAEPGWHAIVVDGVGPMVYGSSLQSTP
ncbi:MAG TPA: M66 family metalloprotease [Actinomycetes bacterium]|nr:M66 family metalloprotease [Actinomycetes bacterium]